MFCVPGADTRSSLRVKPGSDENDRKPLSTPDHDKIFSEEIGLTNSPENKDFYHTRRLRASNLYTIFIITFIFARLVQILDRDKSRCYTLSLWPLIGITYNVIPGK
jgi:hypothetical protein